MNEGGLGFLILIALLGFGTISHIGANNGQHTGYVSSVEQSGIIWKTWRAYIKTDPQSSQEDSYCITDPAVINQLQAIEQSKESVTVNYSSPLLVWKSQCGGESAIINSTSLGGTGAFAWDALNHQNITQKNVTPLDNSKVTIVCNYGNRRLINGNDSGIQFSSSDFDVNGKYTHDFDKNTLLQKLCQITEDDLQKVMQDNSTLFNVYIK